MKQLLSAMRKKVNLSLLIIVPSLLTISFQGLAFPQSYFDDYSDLMEAERLRREINRTWWNSLSEEERAVTRQVNRMNEVVSQSNNINCIPLEYAGYVTNSINQILNISAD